MMRNEVVMNNIDMVDMDILKDERFDLECFIYDMHKSAFGVKGRHYDFKSMSMDDLRKEANRIGAAVEVAEAEEAHAAEVAIADFEATVGETIEAGAGDRETALRWMAMEETFYGKQDVEHWVYKHGFLFTSHGRAVVEELMNIVTFKEYANV
jgi:hypothetical protein